MNSIYNHIFVRIYIKSTISFFLAFSLKCEKNLGYYFLINLKFYKCCQAANTYACLKFNLTILIL